MMRMMAALRATIIAVTLLTGVPVLLLGLCGSPLPDRAPSTAQLLTWLDDPLRPQYVPATARLVAWLIWALLAAAVLTVAGTRVKRWRWARLAAYLPGPVQSLAATLLGAATVTTTAVGALPAHAATPTTVTGTGPSEAATADTTTTTRAAAAGHQGPAAPAAGTVTVDRGDTLWDIAAAQLGDPHDWKQIYRLNTNRYPDMRHGRHIEPGWTLTLPTRATTPAHQPPTDAAPGRPGTATPAPPTAGHTGPQASATTGPSTATRCTTPPVAGPAGPVRSPGSHQDPAGTAALPDPEGNRHREPGAGLTLAGGSWIDLGLAGAVAAAAALVWAHRRRRYTPRPPSPELRLHAAAGTAPLPAVVHQIRRRLRHGAPEDPRGGAHTGPDLHTGPPPSRDDHRLPPATPNPTGQHGSGDVRASEAGGRDETHAEDDELADRHDVAGPSPMVRPVVPALAHPLAALWPPAGLGLTGPGAHAAARGFLTAALAAGGLHAPEERSQVVIPATVATTLLGDRAAALPRTPRLTVTTGLDEALDLLEAHTLHRSRIVYAHEADTVAELRAADPTSEPLPPTVLLAGAGTRHQRTRIAALLTQGQRLDIHGVLLGAWPDGDTITVTEDGSTTPADGEGSRHGHHPGDIGRLTVLTPAETSDLLTTLAESHTGEQQTPPDNEPAATTRTPASAPTTQNGDCDERADRCDDSGEPGTAAPAPPSPQAGVAAPDPHHADPANPGHGVPRRVEAAIGADADQPASGQQPGTTHANTDVTAAGEAVNAGGRRSAGTSVPAGNAHAAAVPGSEPATAEPTDVDTADCDGVRPGRVEITVLGQAGITHLPPGITPRKKSLELLVYLTVHDGTATAEAILDDVLGDAPASKAAGRLYTYVSDLRGVLRRTGGRGAYVTHPAQRYALDRDTVDIDLWRMRTAIRDATHAVDPGERRAALRRAVDTYRGPLADGTDYEWIEPYREAVRQQALDAALALADSLADNPAEQITVLETAIHHHPYTELLYQQAMKARAALGHLDAMRTLHRALTRALAEIDTEPTGETTALADQLVNQPQHSTRPQPRQSARPDHGAAA